jgi:hypothetical protein
MPSLSRFELEQALNLDPKNEEANTLYRSLKANTEGDFLINLDK